MSTNPQPPDTAPTPTAALRERVKAEYLRLDALVAICESDLHRSLIGCPTCQRDERQMDLLLAVDAALLASAQREAALLKALTNVRDDLHDYAKSLTDDAADWREMSDRTSGHTAQQLMTDAIAHEAMAARLRDFEDRLDAALAATAAPSTTKEG